MVSDGGSLLGWDAIPLGDVVGNVLADGGRVVADDETCVQSD